MVLFSLSLSLIQSYNAIEASVGIERGMVPDWMTPEGKFYDKPLGYNAYLDGKGFYKDAIRVLWRVATDYAWFNVSFSDCCCCSSSSSSSSSSTDGDL